ncbi:uncharacterized protein LOC130856543 [Hippopotamus amphibius kiboko]|uniref:uncharacterized protein LOC130856543 n=1 Tax=Hippopotamus amphibius kiboko TaxID=575201 RepID=UPI00259A4C36|nr:uncharacterized protein LOC130856543 [Hippopotamus amphibius kiboko]
MVGADAEVRSRRERNQCLGCPQKLRYGPGLAGPHPPGLADTLFDQLIQLSCEGRNKTGPSLCLWTNNLASSPGPCSLQCCSGGPLCLVLVGLGPRPPDRPRGQAASCCAPGDHHSTSPQEERECLSTPACSSKGSKEVQLSPQPHLTLFASVNGGQRQGADEWSHLFSQLQQSSLGYTAGCSQACGAGTPRCHRAVAQPCYQECCQVSALGSCLQLDSNLHFSGAA